MKNLRPKSVSSREWDELIRRAEIPPESQVYVNRNLRMTGIGAIGFDMDHTLATYDPIPFEELAFDEARRHLIAGGYPAEIGSLRYRPGSVIRGLVVDRRRGNIIKMDQHRYVAQATHGTDPLPGAVRKELYQNQPIRLSNSDFVSIDTPFSLPEIDLYAQLVGWLDRRKPGPRSYRKLYVEVRAAMDAAHADGSIKSRIAADPDRYLRPDPELPDTLARMRRSGYRLFLLTNSEGTYTSLIMERLLGGRLADLPSWTEYFDLIVVRARKPTFFRTRVESRKVALPGVVDAAEAAKCRMGGGVEDLEKRLGCGGDRILYVGDHTYGDILKSKRVRLWRTALVLMELECEIRTTQAACSAERSLREGYALLRACRGVEDHLLQVGRGEKPGDGIPASLADGVRAAVQKKIARLEERLDATEADCERRHNEQWGPMLRTGRELSHFAAQVREFACVYTSRVSNFARYPMGKYFQTEPERLPHDS